MLLALCGRGFTQIISADDVDHVSLLQTNMYRKNKDAVDDPDLNALQHQLNKLQRKVSKVSHVHEPKERKSMMMVDLQSPRPEKDIKMHKARASKSKDKKTKKIQKLDKFAKASLAKAHEAKEKEKTAMSYLMDAEAGELAEDESHVLSAGALHRLEEVAERVAKSKDEDADWQDLEVDEHHDERHSKTYEDKDHKMAKDSDVDEHADDKESGGDDAVDPEAELVRLAHQRAQREEAKAQLAEDAAKDAWIELEKFQAQRNIDSFQTGEPMAFSVSEPGPKDAAVQHHEWRAR